MPPTSPTGKQAGSMFTPGLYHAHHQDFQADLPFWLELARKQDSPLLELGCGTGRVLIPLAEAGYTVYGLDIDADMLQFCRQQIPAAFALKVHTIQADMSAFQFGRCFRLILLPCNTFSTLSAASRASTLACIHRHLSPGGLFAVSIPNPEILCRLKSSQGTEVEMSFPHPTSGNPVQLSYGIKRTEQHLTFDWFYDHLLPDGHVERMVVSTRHGLVTTTAYLQEFNQAGFKVTATYGDFDGKPHGSGTPNLVILAQAA